jgi:hypothetical protein
MGSSSSNANATAEQVCSVSNPCTSRQVPDSAYHRLFAAGIAILAIVIMVLVWFTGLVFQIINFILAFLVLALGVLIVILPIKCKKCECA